jgi:hypothetical protein
LVRVIDKRFRNIFHQGFHACPPQLASSAYPQENERELIRCS